MYPAASNIVGWSRARLVLALLYKETELTWGRMVPDVLCHEQCAACFQCVCMQVFMSMGKGKGKGKGPTYGVRCFQCTCGCSKASRDVSSPFCSLEVPPWAIQCRRETCIAAKEALALVVVGSSSTDGAKIALSQPPARQVEFPCKRRHFPAAKEDFALVTGVGLS